MLGSPRVFKFAIAALVAVWGLAHLNSHRSAYTAVTRQFRNAKDLFISEYLDHEIDGPLDGSALSELCASRQWTPGLILSCDAAAGGFAHVRNAQLNCIRFAIDMGAELILPRIIKRSEKDLTVLRPPNGNGPHIGVPLSHLFDLDHLNATLTTHCPQLRLYSSLDDLWDVPTVQAPRHISIGALGIPLLNSTVIQDLSSLPLHIREYIDSISPPSTRTYPIRFHLPSSKWIFPVFSSKETPASLAHTFASILRPYPPARLLAALALYTLHTRYSLPILSSPLKKNGLLGIHFLSEPDAFELGAAIDLQITSITSFLVSLYRPNSPSPSSSSSSSSSSKPPSEVASPKVAFLATGTSPSSPHIPLLTSHLRADPLNITTILQKRDLLDDDQEALDLLDSMTYDQRALVDYEIMLRVGHVVGPAESDFSWSLALKRSRVGSSSGGSEEDKDEKYPILSGTVGTVDVQWKDRFSALIGKSQEAWKLMGTTWA